MRMHLIAFSYFVEVKCIWFIDSLVHCSSIILEDEAKENKESGSITTVLCSKFESVCWKLKQVHKKLFFIKPRAHFDAPIFIFCQVTLWRVIGFDTSYETYVMITSLVYTHYFLISTRTLRLRSYQTWFVF